MRLVVDANILVGEALRSRGRALLARPDVELYLAEQAWSEAQHELSKRVSILARRAHMNQESAQDMLELAFRAAQLHVTLVGTMECLSMETEARRRIPQDPNDWPTVALALMLDADIWTLDGDFLGCGIGTWTTETLRLQLEAEQDC